jgi:hypothetical protein
VLGLHGEPWVWIGKNRNTPTIPVAASKPRGQKSHEDHDHIAVGCARVAARSDPESNNSNTREIQHVTHVGARSARRARLTALRLRAQRSVTARIVRRGLGAFGHGGVEEWRNDRKQQIRAMDEGDVRGAWQHGEL